MDTRHLPVSQCGGSPSLPALCACGSRVRASVTCGRNPAASRLHPCLVSLQLPAQSVEDPAASLAQDPSREACASLPGMCRSPHSACAPGPYARCFCSHKPAPTTRETPWRSLGALGGSAVCMLLGEFSLLSPECPFPLHLSCVCQCWDFCLAGKPKGNSGCSSHPWERSRRQGQA